MTIELTIAVPDVLEAQLHSVRDRLPEVLERGLREVLAETANVASDEQTIIATLASQPTPEQILSLQPSAALQARLRELLTHNNTGTLTTTERSELDRMLWLEHLVRLAKIHARQRLAQQP